MQKEMEGAEYPEHGSGTCGRVIACDPAKAVKLGAGQYGESGVKDTARRGIGVGHREGPIGC